MGKYKDIDDLFSGLKKKYMELVNRELDAINEETDKAIKDTFEEYASYQRVELQAILNDAATQWYNSYDPRLYDRRGSLYNLLKFAYDEYGMVDIGEPGNRRVLFDASAGPLDRSGKSMFEKIFIRGWHGGALNRGLGIVMYRGPEPFFIDWSSPAVKTKSAYSIFDEELTHADNGRQGYMVDEFMRILTKNNDQAVKRFMDIRVPAIIKEIYG